MEKQLLHKKEDATSIRLKLKFSAYCCCCFEQ